MYKVEWDRKTRGVKLSSLVTADTLGTSPRPVFYEELDLLKMNTDFGWQYPHCEEPLMWCMNKMYFYEGEKVMEAHGANLYDSAEVTLVDEKFRGLRLRKVNVKKMLEVCNDEMFLLESEAMEFIRSTYVQYSSAKKSVEAVKANQIDFDELLKRVEKQSKKKMAIVKQDCDSFDIMPLEDAKASGKKTYQTTKIDKFLASFSGGKDSQVVLDLCTRAIPPDAFEVIYSDTGYELPPSIALYDEVQKYYHDKFPGLKFSTAKNHESVLNYWDQIGTPSDNHRWCCSIMKTAPLYKTLKKDGTNQQAKVLAFDGVRSEESLRRSEYDRIGKGKHTTITNAHPILFWSSVEIFLYLFKYNLPINPAYRIGKARVGCLICPFSTAWDDMIIHKEYPELLKPFTDRIEKWAKDSRIKDTHNYLKERKWKIRVLGESSILKRYVKYGMVGNDFVADIQNPAFSIYKWLPALGEYIVNHEKGYDSGELKYKDTFYNFKLESEKNNHFRFILSNCNDTTLQYLLKRVINKSTHCVQCEVCEVNCPTGALTIYPELNIDKNKCIQCHKCLNFHDMGCIALDNIRMIQDMDKKLNDVVHNYKTFGLRDEWMSEYLCDPDNFWQSNGLGTVQVEAFKEWLKDASVIDSKLVLTEFGKKIAEIYQNDMFLAWELVLINLMYGSYGVRFFANNISPHMPFDKKHLMDLLGEQGLSISAKSIEKTIAALMQMMNYSPVGSDFKYAIETSSKKYVRDIYEDVSETAIAYSLYKYSEFISMKTFRVSDFYDPKCDRGPYREFGIDESLFKKRLRSLSASSSRILLAELNMGLDNITLQENLTPLDILKILA